ncbi:MAG: DUF2867 domain-containing protein [Myxococcota bacterium]
MRATPEAFERIDLRAHSLLAGVPLHDVWSVELAGGGPGRTMLDFRELVSVAELASANPVVKLLFGLRALLGRLFAWDREPAQTPRESFLHRLSAADREASRVSPGTPDGPFRVLFVSEQESISEVLNPTVHAFSVFVLVETPPGYRLYWAVYVQPVGGITAWYMRLIDPFRRLVIYPAVLRHIRAAWEKREWDVSSSS